MKINFMQRSDVFVSLGNNVPFDLWKFKKQLLWRFQHEIEHRQTTSEFSVKLYCSDRFAGGASKPAGAQTGLADIVDSLASKSE